MTQLAVFTSAAFTSASGVEVAANATIEVRYMSDNTLATIYSDEAGLSALTNPSAFADASGRFDFYALGVNKGYSVKVTKGAETYTLNNVAIGTAAQLDQLAFQVRSADERLTLTATVASSALTIAIKDSSGADATTDAPLYVTFRHPTITTGTREVATVIAANSLVISSGSTLGTVSAIAHRLYILAINDVGTIRLCIWNPYDATANAESLVGIDEGSLYSATNEGGAGAADSAQVIYSDAAVTTKSVVILGYIESTQATAGTWDTAPSKIQLMSEESKKTGDIIQRVRSVVTAVSNGEVHMPIDDTIPQNTEGDEYHTLAVTPTSAINLIKIKASAFGAVSQGDKFVAALFQDSTADALASRIFSVGAADQAAAMDIEHQMIAGTAASTTLKLRIGAEDVGSPGAVFTFLGEATTRILGGNAVSVLSAEEIFV